MFSFLLSILGDSLDISEIGFPPPNVCIQSRLEPSQKPCPGMTEMISRELLICTNWMSIVSAVGSAKGS